MDNRVPQTAPKLLELYNQIKSDPVFDELRQPRIKFVGGDGPLNPTYMLVGEAPGRLENARGLAFVGKAGSNLMNILEDVGIDTSDVFYTNIIKYWPQEDGHTITPEPDELQASKKYLLQEIEIVKPKIIGLCGHSAIQTLYPKVDKLFGNAGMKVDERFVYLYHPAASIHNEERRNVVKQGYAMLKNYAEGKA